MTSYLLLDQFPEFRVVLTLMVCEMRGKWPFVYLSCYMGKYMKI